jgi:hypothetical protein
LDEEQIGRTVDKSPVVQHAKVGRDHAGEHLALYRGMVITRLRAARESIAAVQRALDELDKNGGGRMRIW